MKKSKLTIILLLVFTSIISLGIYGFYALKGTAVITEINSPKSYDDIYSVLKKNQDSINKGVLGAFNEDQSFDSSKPMAPTASSKDFSKTNIQVFGVDEADIVKTDGKYIYALLNNYLNIIEVDKDTMKIISKIKASSNTVDSSSNYIEMYISDNKLIVIKSFYQNNYTYDVIRKSNFYNNSTTTVSAVIFDITDKSKPTKINELSQSGNYISSRLIDNYLYITSNYYVYNIEKRDIKTYIPMANEKPIDINDILILPRPTNSYVTITGIDINNSNKHISSKAVLGNSNNIYADTDNIYVVGSDYNTRRDETNIIKFKTDKGVISLEATGKVNGTILNQFSMDEYNDYFRIVTTHYDYNRFIIDDIVGPGEEETTKNNLYVLDKNLKLVSKIEGLAKGERIYSVRFDKDISYFVTFKQVDPLFVVDLSNPEKPVIKTELKIPGFSEYLHVYDDKYLFGLGKEANDKGRVTSLKISMFDISDKNNVIEKYKTVIGNNETWSEASYNHKAILISKSKNLIAFPLSSSYIVYKFDDGKGFTKLKEIKNNDYYYYGNSRGLYIDDYLYVVSPNQVQTVNLNTFEEGKSLEIISTDNKYVPDSLK